MVVVITPDLSPMINKFSDRKELVALLNELKADKDENVISHNDLNLFNILIK